MRSLLSFAVLLLAEAMAAQTAESDTAAVTGEVLDSDGPIGGAIVRVVGGISKPMSTATDRYGSYTLDELPFGSSISLNVSKGNYLPKEGRSIQVDISNVDVVAEPIRLFRATKDITYLTTSVESVISIGVSPIEIWEDFDGIGVDAEVKLAAATALGPWISPDGYAPPSLRAYGEADGEAVALVKTQMTEAWSEPNDFGEDTARLWQAALPGEVVEDIYVSTWLQSCAPSTEDEGCSRPSFGQMRLRRAAGVDLSDEKLEAYLDNAAGARL